MTKKVAEEVADRIGSKHVAAKVAVQTTNGVSRHVVHVTHAPSTEDNRPLAYTLASAP